MRFSLIVVMLSVFLGSSGPALAAEPLTSAEVNAIEKTIETYRGKSGTRDEYGNAIKVPASIYRPSHNPSERTASIVARAGMLFLEAATYWRDQRPDYAATLIQDARRAADSLIAEFRDADGRLVRAWDMDGDGKAGYGRFFSSSYGYAKGKANSRVVDGGYTYFADGACQRNRAYQTDLFDTALVMEFLGDLAKSLIASSAPEDKKAGEIYAKFAKRIADDTWTNGEAFANGKYFYYWRTTGACERGWDIKNVNLMMVEPLLTIARLSGERRYEDRARIVWETERWELGQDGSSPNFGYYGKRTIEAAKRDPKSLKFKQVRGTQSLEPGSDGAIHCNPKSRTCGGHLLREAYNVYEISRLLGTDGYPLTQEMLGSFNGWKKAGGDCFREFRGDSCEGFVCTLAPFDKEARAQCDDVVRLGHLTRGQAWALLRSKNGFAGHSSR